MAVMQAIALLAGLALCVFVVWSMAEKRGGVSAILAEWTPKEQAAAMSRAEQEELRDMVEKMTGLLAVRDYDRPNAVLTVGPVFYLADYRVKSRLCELLLLSTRESYPSVRHLKIIDYRSNKEVGRFSGGRLEIETNPG